MMVMMMMSVPNGQRGLAVLGTRRLFASSVPHAHGNIDTSVSCGWIRTYPRYVKSFSSSPAMLPGCVACLESTRESFAPEKRGAKIVACRSIGDPRRLHATCSFFQLPKDQDRATCRRQDESTMTQLGLSVSSSHHKTAVVDVLHASTSRR